MKLLIYFILGTFIPCFCCGQTLILSGSEEDLGVLQNYDYDKSYTDTAAAYLTIQKLVSDLQKDGYFTASVYIVKLHSDSLLASVNVGRQFEWAYLHAGNLNPAIQEISGFRENFFLDKPFRYDQIKVLFEKILVYAENRGYPFATVSLANVQIVGHKIYADVNYASGPSITFGKLQLKDTDQVKADFLEAYLGILPGSSYDQRKVDRIPDLLKTLPFLTLNAPLEVTFQNETADVVLALSARKSNEFDGVINFFPSEGTHNKLLLTGELNVQLNNLARSGKKFLLRWQRLQVQSQRLDVGYYHPHIFRSPLDAGIHFNLLKEDTLFMNRRLSMEMTFRYGVGNHFSVIASWQGSRLLGAAHEHFYTGEKKLGNYDLTSAGIIYTRQRVDDLLFPRKGYLFSVEGHIGKKKILPDLTVGDISQTQPVISSWQQNLCGKLIQYQRISPQWMLYHKFSGGYLFNPHLFLNDLYRIGGLHSLRGFYDNFFFASQYALSNLELRILFEQQSETYSHIFAFYDQAYLIRNIAGENMKDHPAGLGAGISLATSAGLFNLVYGIGKSESQPFSINLSKIHFGYISRF